jgi:hypothetical protein
MRVSMPTCRAASVLVGAAAVAQLWACAYPVDAPLRASDPAVNAGPQGGLGAVIASTITPTWFNDPGGVALAVDASDNVFTARWDYNPAGDIYVAKRTSAGALLWEVRYDNTDNTSHEVATWVGTDRGGNVLVSGTIRSGYSNPVNANSLLMKFAPDGRLLWRRVYDAAFDGSSTRKLLVDANDNAYVLGIGMTPSGQRTTIRKFAPDGTTLWSWFDLAGVGAPLNFKFTPDGAIVVSGRGVTGSYNGYAKVSLNGTAIWTLAGFYSISVGDVAGDAAGNSYLINGNPSAVGSLLRKVGPSATTLWNAPTPSPACASRWAMTTPPWRVGIPTRGASAPPS